MIQKMNTNSAIAFKLKEKIKILKQDLLNKDKELDEIKMHIKYTKLKELAVERQLLKEECQRLKLALKQKNYVPEGAFKVLQNDTELKGKINILEIDKTNMSEEIKRLEKNCKNEIEKSLLEKKKFEKEKKLLEQNLDKTKNDNIEMKLSQTNEKLKLGEHLSKKVRNFEKDLEVFHKINQRIKEMFGKIESITEIIQILKSNIRSNKEKMNNKQKKCMKLEEQCSSYKIQITKFASILNLKKIIIKNLLANNFSHDELKEFISNIKEKEIKFNFVFELLTKHPFEIKDSEQATLITNYIFAKDKLSLNEANSSLNLNEFKKRLKEFIGSYKLKKNKSDYGKRMEKIYKKGIDNPSQKENKSFPLEQKNSSTVNFNIIFNSILQLYDLNEIEELINEFSINLNQEKVLKLKNFNKFLKRLKIKIDNFDDVIKSFLSRFDPEKKGIILMQEFMKELKEYHCSEIIRQLNNNQIIFILKLLKYLDKKKLNLFSFLKDFLIHKEISLNGKNKKVIVINSVDVKKYIENLLNPKSKSKFSNQKSQPTSFEIPENCFIEIQKIFSKTKITGKFIEFKALDKCLSFIKMKRS